LTTPARWGRFFVAIVPGFWFKPCARLFVEFRSVFTLKLEFLWLTWYCWIWVGTSPVLYHCLFCRMELLNF